MKIYSTSEFRRQLADCLAEAAIETVYIERPGHRLLQLVLVPERDVDAIMRCLKKRNNHENLSEGGNSAYNCPL